MEGPPPPRPRKGPEEYRDLGAAINARHRELKQLVEKYRDLHPQSVVGVPQDPFTCGPREPVPPAFFAAVLGGTCQLIATSMDVPESVPPAEMVNATASAWSEVTKHFAFDGKWIVLAGAIMGTVTCVAVPVSEGVRKKSEAKKIRVSKLDPATQEAQPDGGAHG